MKRVLSFAMVLAMVFCLLPVSAMAASTYVVAGSSNLCGSEWNNADTKNQMTLVDGLYTKVYTNVAVGSYQFKVVANANWDTSYGKNGQNVNFDVTSVCDVTITFNESTKAIVVSGAGVQLETDLKITGAYAVGAGKGKWLNGVNWNPGSSKNKMTEVSPKVYAITFTDVAKGNNLEFKFALNGSWAHSFGTGTLITAGQTVTTNYNGGNSKVNNPYTLADITLTLDLTGYNHATTSGAKCRVDIVDKTTGSETNPIVLEEQENEVTVPAGATVYYQGNFSGMTMTVTGETGFAVIYNGTSTADTEGAVSMSVSSSDPEKPVVFAITNSGSAAAVYSITFEYPVGTEENPEWIYDLSEINVSVAEGNNKGYYYKWFNRAASGSLAISVASATEGVTYDVALVNENTNTMRNLLQYGVDGVISIDINPGDTITIQVAAVPDLEFNYPALDITLTGEIIYPLGSLMNPEWIYDFSEITASVAEGNHQGYYFKWYNRAATGTLAISVASATEGVEYDVILMNENTYAQRTLNADGVDGVVSIDVNPGDTITIQVAAVPDLEFNYPALDITLNGEFIYPVGSQQNPAALVIGSNAATIEEGNSQGYWYTWTATEDGELTITMTDAAWSYQIMNETAGIYNDSHWSDDETVVASESIQVTAGDVVKVMVTTYDPNSWAAPAGTVNFTASFKGIDKTPADVKMIEAKGHVTGIIVSWEASENADVYQIYRRAADASSWTLLKNTRSLAYKDESAEVGVKYYYKVVARNGDLKSSLNIAAVSATRPAPAPTKLDNVTITSTLGHTTGNIIYWDAVEGANVYQVYRLESGAWKLLKNTGSLAYKDETAPVGVKCYYKIVARFGELKSDIATSTSAFAVRPAAAVTSLDDVVMKSATGHTTGNIIYWNAVENAKLYQVYRRAADGTTWELLTNTGSLGYKDTSAEVGVKYYYKVVARNGDVKSSMNIAAVSAIRPE